MTCPSGQRPRFALPDIAITGPVLPAPFVSRPGLVRPEWIDHNGHLNLAYYIVLFDVATDALWASIGMDDTYLERTGCGTFAVETHTLYVNELLEGDATTAHSLILGVDAKRLHIAHELLRDHDGAVAARHELMFLNIDMTARKSTPWPAETLALIQAMHRAHAAAPQPDWTGRRIAIPPPRDRQTQPG
jgi:acyl-CoA thioester hydrolase